MHANRKTTVSKHLTLQVSSAKEITKDGFKERKTLSVLSGKQQKAILSLSVSYFSRKQQHVLETSSIKREFERPVKHRSITALYLPRSKAASFIMLDQLVLLHRRRILTWMYFFSAVASSSIRPCQKWGAGRKDRNKRRKKSCSPSALFACCNIYKEKRGRHRKHYFYLQLLKESPRACSQEQNIWTSNSSRVTV